MAEYLLVDTNVLVRFFTGEPPQQAAKTRELVAKADADELVLVVLPLIVAETIFTLESFYEMDRKDVASGLLKFLKARGIKVVEQQTVFDALQRHHDFNVSIADTYLAAVAAGLGHKVASFDKDFDKFKDITRYEIK